MVGINPRIQRLCVICRGLCTGVFGNHLENIVYHFFRQLWLVLEVKLMEINSNLFSRHIYKGFPPPKTVSFNSNDWSLLPGAPSPLMPGIVLQAASRENVWRRVAVRCVIRNAVQFKKILCTESASVSGDIFDFPGAHCQTKSFPNL